MLATTPASDPPVAPQSQPSVAPTRADAPLALLLLAALCAAYFPALRGGFLMDDLTNLTRPELAGWPGLGRIWFEPGATQQYYPVLHSWFWLQRVIFGEATLGYHLVSLALHAGSALLLVALLRRLRLPGAWLAGFVFALHPIGVDSVAWISEQKNTLSTLFVLAGAVAYLRFHDTRRARDYGVATLWFLLALLAKTPAAALPAVLLVIQWWQQGRLDSRRDVRPLVPWFGAGIAMAAVTIWVERTFIGAQGSDFALSFVERVLLASRALWFYVGKIVWPVDLLFMYPRWTVTSGSLLGWSALLGALIVFGGLTMRARKQRGPLALALLFAGTLFPALGFVDIYWFAFSYVADHFAYLSSLALIAAFAVAVARASAPRRGIVAAVGLICSLVLGGLTWRHSHVYRDYPTLTRETLARNPNAWLLRNNLGVDAAQAGKLEEARGHFAAALQLRPNFAEGHFNLARTLESLPSQTEAAITSYQTALKLQPRYADAHFNLGTLLASAGRLPEAIEHFAAATQLKPLDAEAWLNLGLALEATPGRESDALAPFEKAVRLAPDSIPARLHFALGLANANRLGEAAGELEHVLRQEPSHDEAAGLLREIRAAIRKGP